MFTKNCRTKLLRSTFNPHRQPLSLTLERLWMLLLRRRRLASLSAFHPHPSPLPPPPADKSEWFLPGEPVTVTAVVTAAEVSEQRAGWGGLHPLPAIAVRRLLLWSHTGKTFPFIFCKTPTSPP